MGPKPGGELSLRGHEATPKALDHTWHFSTSVEVVLIGGLLYF